MSWEKHSAKPQLMVTLVTMALSHLKDTKIRDRLLQVIILLNFTLFSGREHLCVWQGFSQRHLLSPRNITSWRKAHTIPRITLNHAMEWKWLGNWARIAATPVGIGKTCLLGQAWVSPTLVRWTVDFFYIDIDIQYSYLVDIFCIFFWLSLNASYTIYTLHVIDIQMHLAWAVRVKTATKDTLEK